MSEVHNLDSLVALRELQAELALKHNLDFKSRSFWISGEINDKMLKHVEGCLSLLEADGNKAITVRINSGGGECYPALAIISRLRTSKCKIKTEGHGHVMSAACAILAAGHKRSISRTTSFMYHESSYGLEGKHSNNKAWVAQMEREARIEAEQMARFTGQTVDYWLESGSQVDRFHSPEELLELNVIDKILED